MPAVSIVIAALEAEDTLGDALASALAQSCGDFEIVIAPTSRATTRPSPHAIRGSGSSPACRRPPGLGRRATAPWPRRAVAGSPCSMRMTAGRPTTSRRSCRRRRRMVRRSGRTSVLDEAGTELRSIPASDYRGPADYAAFGRAFGSFHGLARRVPERHWHHVFAEDVLFDLETLARQGGSAAYNPDAVYYLSARRGSATRSTAFIDGIAGTTPRSSR